MDEEDEFVGVEEPIHFEERRVYMQPNEEASSFNSNHHVIPMQS
jgi:hypothetical protein